jgi:hypothetical protein
VIGVTIKLRYEGEDQVLDAFEMLLVGMLFCFFCMHLVLVDICKIEIEK